MWARDGEGGLAPTIVQFPTRPNNARTMADRECAIDVSYTGTLRPLVDLGRVLISEDGFLSGLIDTISHGIFGMPLAFQGPPEMVSALTDSEGTPGEWGQLHPENEGAKILADGLVFNHGFGQYVFGPEDLVRAVGVHRVPRLMWRDPRSLRRDPYTKQWYFMSTGGEVAINPGDGEWLLFQPYPDHDSWRHGPVLYITLAAIFARDSLFDRQRVSEVCAPTRIARAVKPTTPAARRKMAEGLAKMAHDNHITLPHEWLYEIVTAAAGDYWKVCGDIVTWARQMVEVGLTGNILSVEGPSGFSNADIYRRVNDSRRRFYANAWTRCVREQGLTWWVRDNYGEPWVARCPVPIYNVQSPEDAKADAERLKAWGEGIEALTAGLATANLRPVQSSVIEMLQRAGIRAEPIPAAPPPVSAPAPQASPIAGEPDEDEEPEPDEAARLADEMTAHGSTSCFHEKTNRCAWCGVQAVRSVVPPAKPGEAHGWRLAWKPYKPAPRVPVAREAVAA